MRRLLSWIGLVFAAASYCARPWSCATVLQSFSPQDGVAYARFDYHGVGVMTGIVAALIFALPMLRLSTLVLFGSNAKPSVHRRLDGWAWLVAVALALPSTAQLAYLIGLPLRIVMPIGWSSLAWVCAVALGVLCYRELSDLQRAAQAGRLAVGLAGIITVPKLILVSLWTLPA